MKGNPKQGEGDKKIDCDLYEDCLGYAAKKDWHNFNCEACTYIGKGQGTEPTTTAKKENTRICEDCKEKPTLSPNCPLCPSCMAKRSNQGRSAKQEPKAKRPRGRPPKMRPTGNHGDCQKGTGATQSMPKPEKAAVGSNMALTIEFGKYGHILKEIQKLAEEEVRPVELQVIYMLKNALSECRP